MQRADVRYQSKTTFLAGECNALRSLHLRHNPIHRLDGKRLYKKRLLLNISCKETGTFNSCRTYLFESDFSVLYVKRQSKSTVQYQKQGQTSKNRDLQNYFFTRDCFD